MDEPRSEMDAEHKPFVPASETQAEISFLPLLVGALLGILFGASSMYLVLKVGMTVSASIPVAVLSITLFRAFSKAFGIRRATILENNIVQTTGSAGEGIAFGAGVTMPAMLILGYDLNYLHTAIVAVLGGDPGHLPHNPHPPGPHREGGPEPHLPRGHRLRRGAHLRGEGRDHRQDRLRRPGLRVPLRPRLPGVRVLQGHAGAGLRQVVRRRQHLRRGEPGAARRRVRHRDPHLPHHGSGRHPRLPGPHARHQALWLHRQRADLPRHGPHQGHVDRRHLAQLRALHRRRRRGSRRHHLPRPRHPHHRRRRGSRHRRAARWRSREEGTHQSRPAVVVLGRRRPPRGHRLDPRPLPQAQHPGGPPGGGVRLPLRHRQLPAHRRDRGAPRTPSPA